MEHPCISAWKNETSTFAMRLPLFHLVSMSVPFVYKQASSGRLGSSTRADVEHKVQRVEVRHQAAKKVPFRFPPLPSLIWKMVA